MIRDAGKQRLCIAVSMYFQIQQSASYILRAESLSASKMVKIKSIHGRAYSVNAGLEFGVLKVLRFSLLTMP